MSSCHFKVLAPSNTSSFACSFPVASFLTFSFQLVYLIKFLQFKQQRWYYTHICALSFLERLFCTIHTFYPGNRGAVLCEGYCCSLSMVLLLDDHFYLLVIPHPIKYVARFGGVVYCCFVNTSAAKCLKGKEMISLLSPSGALR